MIKNRILSLAVLMLLSIIPAGMSYGQMVPQTYANYSSSLHWKEIQTPHFEIVFPQRHRSVAWEIAPKAEQIYQEYKERLGQALHKKIALYYHSHNEIVSGIQAQRVDGAYSIWTGNLFEADTPVLTSLTERLRYVIASAYQLHIQSIIPEYLHYLSYPPPKLPWPDGLPLYLAEPHRTSGEMNALQHYIHLQKHLSDSHIPVSKWIYTQLGRSQIQYFKGKYGSHSLQAIYDKRQSLLGLFHYFDFEPAFKETVNLPYNAFVEQWKQHERHRLESGEAAPDTTDERTARSYSRKASPNDIRLLTDSAQPVSSASNFTVQPYHSFLHMHLKTPIGLPYYASPDNYGFAAYLQFQEPMRMHKLTIAGLFSLAHPLHKTYFLTKYVNNSFGPRLELAYNRFTHGALIIGRPQRVQTSDVLALTSLWKLDGLSKGYSNWYIGLRLRHMYFDYLPDSYLRKHYPHIFYVNKKNHQTDLKASLIWRKLKPSRNTFINPEGAKGIRLSATGSDNILGSDVQYARLSLDGYTVLPAFKDHHIYLYANGAIDIGAPAGRDYLEFTKGGNYELRGPRFMGRVNPGLKRFVPGYSKPLLGTRFLFGQLEYRIPFEFNTTKKLFGFIPPARTVFTFFTDSGLMGDARIEPHQRAPRFRWGAGAEIKRVFSIKGAIKLVYELGIGQALTHSFAPRPYFRVQMPLAF